MEVQAGRAQDEEVAVREIPGWRLRATVLGLKPHVVVPRQRMASVLLN